MQLKALKRHLLGATRSKKEPRETRSNFKKPDAVFQAVPNETQSEPILVSGSTSDDDEGDDREEEQQSATTRTRTLNSALDQRQRKLHPTHSCRTIFEKKAEE